MTPEERRIYDNRHWVADREAKVLICGFSCIDDARIRKKEMEKEDKDEGIYIRGFYELKEGAIGALRKNGYTLMPGEKA